VISTALLGFWTEKPKSYSVFFPMSSVCNLLSYVLPSINVCVMAVARANHVLFELEHILVSWVTQMSGKKKC